MNFKELLVQLVRFKSVTQEKADHAFFANKDVRCNFKDLTANYPGIGENLLLVQIVHVFGFYWLFNLVAAIGQFTLAGSFSQWYWCQLDSFKHLSSSPVKLAFGFVLKNFGTLLFGSFIIAVINTIRAIIQYIEKKTKKSNNKVVKAIICCMKCCFACVEKCMKFINKNAYIICGIYGYNFCKSACAAVRIIGTNLFRFAAVEAVTKGVIKLGILVVTVGTTFLAVFIFDPSKPEGVK